VRGDKVISVKYGIRRTDGRLRLAYGGKLLLYDSMTDMISSGNARRGETIVRFEETVVEGDDIMAVPEGRVDREAWYRDIMDQYQGESDDESEAIEPVRQGQWLGGDWSVSQTIDRPQADEYASMETIARIVREAAAELRHGSFTPPHSEEPDA
jgi:hypothetical protein